MLPLPGHLEEDTENKLKKEQESLRPVKSMVCHIKTLRPSILGSTLRFGPAHMQAIEKGEMTTPCKVSPILKNGLDPPLEKTKP
jgi:hypothetical protein